MDSLVSVWRQNKVDRNQWQMNFRCVIKVVFYSLVVSACSLTQPKLQEIQLPMERIVQNGYSLGPMNEDGWFVLVRDQYNIALAKAGANPDESIAIQAMPFRLPEYKSTEEFLRLIKDGQAKDTDLQRFVVTKHEVVAYPKKGVTCAKSHIVTEDRAAIKRSTKSGSMILAAMSLTCAHPKNISVGVSVTYSHRYYPEQGDALFVEKARNVLDSVEFSDL